MPPHLDALDISGPRSEVDACRPLAPPSSQTAARISISIFSVGARFLNRFREYDSLETRADWETVDWVAREAAAKRDPGEYWVQQAMNILKLEGVPEPNLVLSCMSAYDPAPESSHTGLSLAVQAGKAIVHALINLDPSVLFVSGMCFRSSVWLSALSQPQSHS